VGEEEEEEEGQEGEEASPCPPMTWPWEALASPAALTS
jgi:hypothetical protein